VPSPTAAASASPAAHRRAELAVLLGVCALAGVARALRWWLTPVLHTDGPRFIHLARVIAEGDWDRALEHPFHPLYPALIAAVQPLAGEWARAGAWVGVASGTAAVAAAYALLRGAFGRTPAAVGALLLAVHPRAIEYSADVLSDASYLALWLGALACLWRGLERRSAGAAAAAGVLAGLAYLTRPEGAGVVLVGALLGGLEWLRHRWSLGQTAAWGLALGLGAALAIAPYVGYQSARHGTLVLTQKKSLGALVGVPALDTAGGDPVEEELPGEQWRVAREKLEGVPGPSPFPTRNALAGAPGSLEALAELGGRVISTARPELALLTLLGLLAARGRPSARGRFFGVTAALYAGVLWALISSSGYASHRHALPVVALGLGYAALGTAPLGRWLVAPLRRLGRAPSTAAATAAAVALVTAAGLAQGVRPGRLDGLADRRAGEWLQPRVPPGHSVASIKRRVAFYAHAPHTDLRMAPSEAALLAYLRASSTAYVVVNDKQRRELLRLIAAEPDALHLVHTAEAVGERAYVYELVR
jgi:4-amino-4-deoxy-L-arabinose transferase-like glycosyltransferase